MEKLLKKACERSRLARTPEHVHRIGGWSSLQEILATLREQNPGLHVAVLRYTKDGNPVVWGVDGETLECVWILRFHGMSWL